MSARTCTRLAACATLLVLLASTARAQTLTLQTGDSVTVSGTGTAGTYQGQPINNTTSTYSNGPNAGTGTDITVQAGASFTLGNGALLDGGNANGSAVVALLVQGGTVTVNGGTVRGGFGYGTGLQITSGTAIITGGTFGDYTTTALRSSGGLLQVSGGIFGAHPIFTTSGGIIDLFGTFRDGSGNPLTAPIVTTQPGGTFGTLQGTFSNGSILAPTNYSVYSPGIIEFNVGPVPAPEPSQWAAFAIGFLGLGALTLRARRRTA